MGTDGLRAYLSGGNGGAAAALFCIAAGLLLLIVSKSYAAKHGVFEKRRRRRNPFSFLETDILVTHGKGMTVFWAVVLSLLLAGGMERVPAAESLARESGQSGAYILMKNERDRLVLLKENTAYKPCGNARFLLEGAKSAGETVWYTVRAKNGQAVWREMEREFCVEETRWRGKGEVLVTVRSDIGGKTNWEKHYRLLF